MARQQDTKPHERQGDDRDLEDIETEIDEALEDVDEGELDQRLDKATERADEVDPDEVLIELEDEDEGEEDEPDADGAEEKAGRGERKTG
jgi:hypothetical protein